MEVAVVPVIALPPEGCGEDALVEAARAIDIAFRHVGFFAVTDHSVPEGVIGAAWEATRTFFDAPAEEKMRVGMPYKVTDHGCSL
jgi:isopenicillin N synthase-like dioxygenase